LIAQGYSDTPLAIYTGVNFQAVEARTILDQRYFAKLQSGELSRQQIDDLVRHQSNIATEYRIVLKAVKAA
jgi:hypothetical protein